MNIQLKWLSFNFDHCRWYSFHMVLQPLTSTHVTTPPARSLAAKNLLQGKTADVMRFKEWLCWARDGCQLQILKQHVASNVRRPIGSFSLWYSYLIGSYWRVTLLDVRKLAKRRAFFGWCFPTSEDDYAAYACLCHTLNIIKQYFRIKVLPFKDCQ